LAKLGPELAMPFKMDTFHSILHKQVDFKWEAYHLSVFAANFAREIAEAKKMQAERLERLAQQASAKVSSTVETVTNKIEQLSTATGVPNHSLLFPAVCAKLVSDRVLVETWARGVTVAELFPKLAKVADSERNAAFSAAANPDINAPVDPIQQQTWLQKVAKEEEAAALLNRPNTSQWRRSDADATQLLEQANLANKIADMSFKMFLRDNYVHCDLHAGNLLYDRETDTLTVIDVGLVTKIEKDVAPAFGDFLRALVVLDPKTLAQKLMQFHNPAAVAPNKAGPVLKEIEEDMRSHLLPFQGKKFDVGDVVALVLHRIPHLRLMIRDDVAGNLCAMAFCEGLIMSLNPECDLVKASLPYFIRFKGWSSAKQLLEWGYLENDAQSTATPASPKL
jgi:predicted unusual protein kinase regulating ubiquinone biosynthesis (AarF/ABC1/UbiB family)